MPPYLLQMPLLVEVEEVGEDFVMGGFGPAVAPGEFAFAPLRQTSPDQAVEGGGFVGGGEEEIAGGDAVLGFWGEVVGVGIEVVEGEAAGGVDVVPAVGFEDGAIHLLVQVAEFEDVGVAFFGVVETVVGVGETLVITHHEVSAVFVVGFADCFKGGVGFPVFGEGKGLKATSAGVTKIIFHR